MEIRKIFDTIPEEFDKHRPRYGTELFESLIDYSKISHLSTVLEIGPGTGQATDPILDTGCDYNAIELGEHLCEMMVRKYSRYPNFKIVNGDFITYDFGAQKFDMIYSALAIQWIPEDIAFKKTFELLKPGGTLAMITLEGDYKTPNEDLYNRIQQVYSDFFKPDVKYEHGDFRYSRATDYGFVDFMRREFRGRREYTADEFVAFRKTHSDHMVIPEPYYSQFFDGLRKAVLEAGDRITFIDTYVLYTAKRPL